jgi:prefoldin subunit 5
MPDHIDPDAAAHFIREATIAMDHAAHTMNVLTALVEQLRQDRAELRKALYECSYCLNSLDVAPSAMTKTTMDTLVRMNLGGFND